MRILEDTVTSLIPDFKFQPFTNNLMMKRIILIAALLLLAAFLVVMTMQPADARTVNFSGTYTDINLFGGERLKVFNDDTVEHSITGYNGTFDSGLIGPNGMTDMGFFTDGDYSFYDKHNPQNVGIIHVRTQESAPPTLDAGFQHEAGTLFTITGTGFAPSSRVDIEIYKPDGSAYHLLQVLVTSEGAINLPIQTGRTDQNGLYNVIAVGHKQSNTAFTINGGVTEDNPTVPAPVTPSQPPATQTPNPTPPTQTSITKQALIDWIKQQITYYQELLAIVEAS